METIAFHPVYLKHNMGHGNARSKSLKYSNNVLVALMDADDISMRNRFELQLKHFIDNPSLGIVGGQISEFVGDPSNIIDIREVPLKHNDIKEYLKKRCPVNQMTVMFKKNEVQRAGGYIDWYCEEDYYLWTRMMLNGCRFENVPETLVNVRVGKGMSSRRGGMKYFNREAKFQTYLLQKGVINPIQWLYNVGLRFGGEVILSNSLREKAFKLFRSSSKLNSVTNTHAEARQVSKMSQNGVDKKSYPPFSVAMCVYGKDNPDWFDAALNSVIDQTVKPDEIVLVVDGPVPDEIQRVIDKYSEICSGGGTDQRRINFRVIYFKSNQGLGRGLRRAIEKCSNEIIARMDSDDIAVWDRFEHQLKYMEQNPEIDILGGQIEEFIGDVSNTIGKREVPLTDNELKVYMKKRCPFNHMTVMYKKSAVLKAGNYKHWPSNEDYYLWIRMAFCGCTFANLSEVLVNVRVGKEMYERRGGMKYFRSEEQIQRLMLDKGMISVPRYMVNVGERLALQVLMPNRMRGWVFQKFARKK